MKGWWHVVRASAADDSGAEDFDEHRAQVQKFHKEEAVKVTEVNENFYQAMSNQNLELMGSTWRNDEFVQFVHEGTQTVRGYDAVMTVFKRMFAPKDKLRKYCIAPEEVNVFVRGHSARVSCIEEVLVSGMGARPRRRFSATNLFRKVGTKWKLVHHHASLIVPRSSSSKMLPEGTKLSALGGGGGGNRPRIITLSGNVDSQGLGEVFSALREEKAGLNAALGKLIGSGSASEITDSSSGDGAQFRLVSSSSDSGSSDSSSGDGSMEARLVAAASSGEEEDDDRNLTRKTVAAVRDAHSAGYISATEKRVLLTDIIAHATSDKPSMIEVAYELLQDEGSTTGDVFNKKETAEEFAEQCRIFAKDIQSGE